MTNYNEGLDLVSKTKENYAMVFEYAECLLGAAGLSCFERAAEVIKDCRHYNDSNYSSLRSMISGYEGLAMSGILWPWEGRRVDTHQRKRDQFIIVMLYLDVTIHEIAVLLEGNPRNAINEVSWKIK
jgi:hypothetical protein